MSPHASPRSDAMYTIQYEDVLLVAQFISVHQTLYYTFLSCCQSKIQRVEARQVMLHRPVAVSIGRQNMQVFDKSSRL